MKTIRVRAAVAVNPLDGLWVVFGSDECDDDELAESALTYAGDGFHQITFITAKIPIRDTPEVGAEVEP